MNYSLALVISSFSVATLASYAALNLAGRITNASRSSARYWLVGGAMSMGTGIWSMHFIGMLALILPFSSSYDAILTAGSLLIAMLFSGLALHSVSRKTLGLRRLAGAASGLSVGIGAMHYVGMGALNLSIPITYDSPMVAASLLVAFGSSIVALWLAFRLRGETGWQRYVARIGAALVMGAGIAATHYTGMAAASFDPTAICIGGIPIEGVGFATSLTMVTAGILSITLIVTLFDAQLQSHQGRFIGKLRKENAALQDKAAAKAEELEDLYEHAPCGYHSLNADGVFVRINQTELTWLGYSREEVLGRLGLADLLTPASRLIFERHLSSFKQGGTIDGIELDFMRRDGTVLSVSVNATSIRDDDGRFVSSRGTLHDITARKRAEVALHRSTAFLDSVLENMPITVFVKDVKDGKYLRFNKAAESLLGIDRNLIIGRIDAEILPPDRASVHAQRDELVLAKNGLIHFDAEQVRVHDGFCPTLKTTMTVIPDENGQPLFLLGITEDVTRSLQINAELKRKTREADDASRAKSAFLAAMSHEIRTPMNGVVGMLEVLRLSTLSEEQAEMVEGIKDSANNLLDIIDDILDFSKIEAGRMDLERVASSIEEVMESTGDSLASIAHKLDVELLVHCDPRIPKRLWTDPTRLRQILMNLAGNAIKFSGSATDRKGDVLLRAELSAMKNDRATVVFRVSDNGIGMSDQSVQTLFRPFVQAESSTTRRFGGTGLGLTISQHIAQAMGSEIVVRSVADMGSTFSVSISFDVVHPIEPAVAGNLQGLRIVAVASDPTFDSILRDYSTDQGAEYHNIENRSDLAAAIPAGTAIDDQTVFVLFPDHESAPAMAQLKATIRQAHSAGRFVEFCRGFRRPSLSSASDAVIVGRTSLRRASLIRVFQTATGRASPEIEARVEHRSKPLRSLSVDEAEKAGRLILVAEDHPNNRKVLAHQLAILGHTAEMAENGKAALEMWHCKQYAMVLTDCHMPEIDGFELTATIRRLQEGTGVRTPIVAITANAMKGEADKCLRAGMDDFLTKPLKLGQLGQTLRRWLGDASVLDVSTPADVEVGLDAKPTQAILRPLALADALGTDDADTLRDFYQDFVDSTQTLIAQLSQKRSDISAVSDRGMLAHRLKSSAATVGADRLAELSQELENACKQTDEVLMSRLVVEIESTFEAVRNWMIEHEI